jgi:tRNA 2-thiouridine synthesizing protein A
VELDTRGLRCPLPVLKARRAMKEVPAGGVLTVFATDPGSVADFAAFCEATGFELLDSTEADGVYTFRIRKPE